MTTVFLLFHSHDLSEGEADDKLIGVYLSREDAQQTQERAALLDGFINVPDGFVISAYKLGEGHWTKGYITVVAGRPVARGDQS